jgi:hypothetical protein
MTVQEANMLCKTSLVLGWKIETKRCHHVTGLHLRGSAGMDYCHRKRFGIGIHAKLKRMNIVRFLEKQ